MAAPSGTQASFVTAQGKPEGQGQLQALAQSEVTSIPAHCSERITWPCPTSWGRGCHLWLLRAGGGRALGVPPREDHHFHAWIWVLVPGPATLSSSFVPSLTQSTLALSATPWPHLSLVARHPSGSMERGQTSCGFKTLGRPGGLWRPRRVSAAVPWALRSFLLGLSEKSPVGAAHHFLCAFPSSL